METNARSLGSVALFGSLVFALVVIGQSILRSDRSVVADYLSEYAIGPGGWVQTLGFFVLAATELALAAGLYLTAKGNRLAKVGAALFVLAAIGDILSGVFPTDLDEAAATTTGNIHDLVGFVSFVLTLVTAFLFTRIHREDASWSRVRRAGLVVGVLFVVSFFLIAAGDEAGFAGLVQRSFILVLLVWYVLLGTQLRGTSQEMS